MMYAIKRKKKVMGLVKLPFQLTVLFVSVLLICLVLYLKKIIL